MKKYYLVVFGIVLLFTVTGCGKNKIVCSKSETSEGITMSVDVTVNLDKDDKATGASIVYDFGDKTTADTYCEFFKESDDSSKVDCSGTKITIKDIDAFDDEEVSSEKIVGKTKDEIIKAAEEDGFKCK